MNLNIDGHETNLTVNTNKPEMNAKVLAFLANPEPFMIYNNRSNGVMVLPEQRITFDLSTGSITKHDVVDQLEWVIACAVLAFEKVRALNLEDKKKLLAAIEAAGKVEKPENKIILLN